jgi:predicted RND superfamily exporter protein
MNVFGTTVANGQPSTAQFDPRSGSIVERALFNHRFWVLLLCLLTTLVLGYQCSRVELNASFEKMIPTHHPYIANYLKHQQELSGLGNALRIAVANKKFTTLTTCKPCKP